MHPADELQRSIDLSKSIAVVGLDPRTDSIPPSVRQDALFREEGVRAVARCRWAQRGGPGGVAQVFGDVASDATIWRAVQQVDGAVLEAATGSISTGRSSSAI